MKITATKTSQNSELEDNYTVDTTIAGANSASDLERAIANAHFFSTSPVIPQSKIKPNTAQWKILITHGDQIHSVSFFEDGSPQTAQWQKLVGKIKRLAQD